MCQTVFFNLGYYFESVDHDIILIIRFEVPQLEKG